MPVLLYLLALAVFAQGTSEFVFSGLLPLVSDDFGLPLARAGLLTPAFALGMVLGAPAMAILGRRWHPRAALGAFLALFMVAHAAAALTDSFEFLLATRVLAAVANAGFLAIALGVAARLVAPAQRARALAVLLGGTTLALIAGVPLGAAIGQALGWRATLWVIAAACAPVLWAVVRSPRERFGAPAELPARGAAFEELRVLRDPGLRWVLASAVLVNAATFGSLTFLSAIALAGGVSAPWMPALLALFGVGAFLGTIAAGRLGDRYWRTALRVAGPTLAIAWFAAALVGRPAALWVAVGVLGALSFLFGTLLIGRIMALSAGAATLSGAFATVALNLGAIAGPLLAAPALGRLGSHGPFLVSGALVSLGVLGWWVSDQFREGSA